MGLEVGSYFRISCRYWFRSCCVGGGGCIFFRWIMLFSVGFFYGLLDFAFYSL